MKVIFIKDVKGQGKKDDIKEVKEGYGDFLIKSGSAVLYTNKSLEVLNKQQEIRKEEADKIKAEAIELRKELEKVILKFNVKAGKDGKVFGNISSKQISEELKKKGFNIDKKKIIIDYPLNMVGKFIVKIILHKEVTCDLRVELII